jgi:hypothetical protein
MDHPVSNDVYSKIVCELYNIVMMISQLMIDIDNLDTFSIYKRILHVMNKVLRLNNLTLDQYNIIYILIKDGYYKSPYNEDGMSYELLKSLSIILSQILTNTSDIDTLKICFSENIQLTLSEEIILIKELYNPV